MRWAEQLIKLTSFELELLQARLAEIVERRTLAELRLAVLVAEGEAELEHVRHHPESARTFQAFNEALKRRKDVVQRDIDLAAAEEAGARDALSETFATLKKYEQIAENARLAALRDSKRRESAALDELGLRQATARG
ncbi:MAG: flagellar FliJ family protein [Caulobacteraceae bacterium]|nr:flagellar FliJ family protein [Caulobacteraceae bacterium]